MKKGAFFALALLIAVGAAGAYAQPAGRVINGGMLNGHALTLPKPEYPESARQAKIGGIVGVNVLVDESGAVVSAIADEMDQHEVRDAEGKRLPPTAVDVTLREAAETAARLATFAPLPAKLKGKILYVFVADNSDQPPRVGEIFGPLLNGRAMWLPQPDYSPAAKAAKASGTVTVHVVVNTEGNVISASATSGLPLLRAAAVAAALKAKFEPELMAGQPVRFDGVLTYTFPATKSQ